MAARAGSADLPLHGGRVPPWLGQRMSRLGAVVVESVIPGGPAARAGIKPGEVIVSVAGKSITTTDGLSSVLATLRPGQAIPVQILSPNGQLATVQVTLGSQPGH